jgi:hypothetical protein
MRRVVLESPYAGDVTRNVTYARLCLADSLARGEAPIASHLLHTQILDDTDAPQRTQGIAAGHAWIPWADAVVVYRDLGESPGMRAGVQMAEQFGVPVEGRFLYGADGAQLPPYFRQSAAPS